MLVLARKRSEMIQIGTDIIVKVIETGSRWVKIGIEAPDDVLVVRAELFGIRGPQHPLAAFLQERRQLRRARRQDGKPPHVSDMLEQFRESAAGAHAGELVRTSRRDLDDG